MLSDDYAQYDDADEGPLKPGDIGTLLEDDGSSTPYHVQAASGETWWYKKAAITKYQVGYDFWLPACSWNRSISCYSVTDMKEETDASIKSLCFQSLQTNCIKCEDYQN
jgi:hypothetical protein